jgi:patatin-like phospholipase/acyl hydrolase
MNKPVRILSIDGGGIRGILPAGFLSVLEERLQAKAGNSELTIADFFDFIAGTSTGGVLTCIYLTPDEKNPLKPRYSARDALNLYMRYGFAAFSKQNPGSFHKYYPEELENSLQLFFKDLHLSQLLKPCCVTAYDLLHSEPFTFQSQKAMGNPKYDFFVRAVSRACSALPGVFPPASIISLAERNYTFIDGSIFAYNPAMYAFIQARQLFPQASDYLVLSLGTGVSTNYYSEEQLNNDSEGNWARLLADIAFAAHSDNVNFELNEIFKTWGNSRYIRLQPSLLGLSKDLDNVSEDNINALQKSAEAFIKLNEKTMNELVDLLNNE